MSSLRLKQSEFGSPSHIPVFKVLLTGQKVRTRKSAIVNQGLPFLYNQLFPHGNRFPTG